jgi:hypothetical protein
MRRVRPLAENIGWADSHGMTALFRVRERSRKKPQVSRLCEAAKAHPVGRLSPREASGDLSYKRSALRKNPQGLPVRTALSRIALAHERRFENPQGPQRKARCGALGYETSHQRTRTR